MPRQARGYISGFKECREVLQDLSRGVQRNVGKRALTSAAELGAAAVRSNAPVSHRASNPTPGSLRDSIQVVPAKTEKGRPRVAILTDDKAGVPNEFGTSKMSARTFFRPAIDRVRAAMAALFGERLKVEVEAAAKRAARKAAKA